MLLRREVFLNLICQKKKTAVQYRHGCIFVVLRSTKKKIFQWIQDIQLTAIGQETWFAIKSSGHKLMLMHSAHALSSAGKTLAEMSKNLQNGIGTDAIVQMHFDMPINGTHLVNSSKRKWIPFVAKVNLFHELSHARHMMNGTLLVHDIEGQAVEDENIYRLQKAELDGLHSTTLRDFDYSDFDQQIWFPKWIFQFGPQ